MSGWEEIASSLPRLLLAHAESAPERTALIGQVGSAPAQLDYETLARAVSAMAERLRGLNLAPRSPVAVRMPNCAEAIVTQLAIIAAGHVCVPLPLLWRHSDAAPALGQIDASALIAWCGDMAAADAALDIAAHTPSIRFVAGFGKAIPDDIIGLDDVFSLDAESAHPFEPSSTQPILITFESDADGMAPVAHTHAELLAAALDIVAACRLQQAARIRATMFLSSFATITATLAPWLITGGTLCLSDLAEVLISNHDFDADLAIVPAALLDEPPSARAHLTIWRAPELHAASAARPGINMVDVLAFGEQGFAVLPRLADESPLPLRTGAQSPEANLTLGRSARGTLVVSGRMVPRFDVRGQPLDGFADTGIPCQFDAMTRGLSLSGAPIGVITIGGYRFPAAALHDVVSSAGGDGVLAALPDLIAGERLAGVAANVEELRAALARAGVNPLVGQAFRQRQQG